MSEAMTLVGMRRQGGAALVAGIVLLMAVPLYQAFVLAPSGYLEVTARITARQQFGPYLAWAATHAGIDTGYRLVELLPFVLALGLPGVLRRILWPEDAQRGRVTMALGQAGFAIFALAIAIATFAAASFARQYAAHPATAAAIAHGYMAFYGFETLLANVLAGGLIAVFLVLASLRGSAAGRLPGWLAYLGLATGGLLGATAVLFLFALTQTETPTASLSIVGLAFWLMAVGVLLLRIQVRPQASGGSAAAAVEPSAPTH